MFKNFPYIRFTRSQQIGITLLFSLIIILQLALYFFDRLFPPSEMQPLSIPAGLQIQYDSLKKIAIEKKKHKIYPFNPNYLSGYRAYFLGINPEALDKIQAYRKQGKYFRNKEEFKKISGISDSLYRILEPYIQFPRFHTFPKYNPNKNRTVYTKDINKASAPDLQVIKGIGPVLSQRIIKYRESMGGFTSKEQLNNVYGLEKEVINRLWKVFYLSPADIKPLIKTDINTANIEDLKKVNGIGEILAGRIIDLRNKTGGFAIKEELRAVYGLKPEARENLWKFFEIEHPKIINKKIDLNESNIKELARHPYIDYQLAKKIVSYRTLHGGFKNIHELKKMENFPQEKYKIIELYLKLEP